MSTYLSLTSFFALSSFTFDDYSLSLGSCLVLIAAAVDARCNEEEEKNNSNVYMSRQ